MSIDRILDGIRLVDKAANREDLGYDILSININPGTDETKMHLSQDTFFEFVKDKNYQSLVERRPRYYKNWTRYWLDLDGVEVFCLVECKEAPEYV